MTEVTRAGLVAIAVFVIIASIGVAVHLSVPQDNTAANDIYYCYAEGQNIVAGINPYLRILGGNMRENQKYPTYFPLFYFIAAASQKVGLTDYQQWLALFRWISLAFNVGTGSLLFYLLWRRKGLLLAIIGGLFWFLNRWNLQITQSANFSFLPVFFLILSLWFLPRHRLAALLLLSLSLSLKQVAVVLLPLYLIWIWQAAEEQPGRATTKGLAAALSVPVLLAIPFLVWPGASVFSNIEGFAKSILFSITRDPAAHVNAPSVDSLLGLTGPLARVPVFTLLALVYVAFARHKLGFYTASLLAIAVLLDFNPVLFVQYFCWLVPFILLVTTEIDTGRRPGVGA